MSIIFNWTCPYCEQPTTITGPNHWTQTSHIETNAEENKRVSIKLTAIGCPNQNCNELTLFADMHKSNSIKPLPPGYKSTSIGNKITSWNLLPRSKAKQFPDYVPEAIRQDYKEACLILNDSPKASAALSRRCLQGIVRDFWELPKGKRGKLGAELKCIEDKCDPDTWSGIDAIRSVGNIGAHMEKDVDLIIEVEPNEAELLVELIETLITDWYVGRHKRKARAERAKALTSAKLDQKRAAKKEGNPPILNTTDNDMDS